MDVEFVYSVDWYSTDLTFKQRNLLLRHNDNEESLEIHWLSIMNSLILVVLLIGFVAIILIRIIHSDYSRYSKERQAEDEEDYGWKLVHGDVFRFPPYKVHIFNYFFNY